MVGKGTLIQLGMNEIAEKFVAECRKYGWTFESKPSIVRVSKRFTPGSNEEFTQCESEANYLLSLVPLKGGSIWGTDGASIGGYSGLIRGEFVLAKSGNNGKRLHAKLQQLLYK